MHLIKTARHIRPQLNEMAIFLIVFKKYTPFEFGFCTGKCYQKLKSVQFGWIGRPPIFQNGPQNGAPNNYHSHFFHKNDPTFNLDFV